jgi:hypothetical protein
MPTIRPFQFYNRNSFEPRSLSRFAHHYRKRHRFVNLRHFIEPHRNFTIRDIARRVMPRRSLPRVLVVTLDSLIILRHEAITECSHFATSSYRIKYISDDTAQV